MGIMVGFDDVGGNGGAPVGGDDPAASERALREAANREGSANPPAQAQATTPAAQPAPSTAPAGTPPAHCSVAKEPTYTPSGEIQADYNGPKKEAHFEFEATFNNRPGLGEQPRCCEFRQYVKMDQEYAASHGGPMSSGFPQDTKAGEFVEDRNQTGYRYGHRNDQYTSGKAGDRYTDSKTGLQDDANGDKYKGDDSPHTRKTYVHGKTTFEGRVIDTCNGNKTVASSSPLVIDWGGGRK
jgi:hypothetical protein